MKFLLTFTVLISIQSGLSQLSNLREKYIAKNRRLLEHVESAKCLTVSSDFSLVLEKCNYDPTRRGGLGVGGVFQVIKSNVEGHLMKWASRPVPGAIQGCIQVQTEKSEKPSENDHEDDDDELKIVGDENQKVLLGACDPRDSTLTWEFSKVDEGKYLLRKLPSGPCVAPSSHELGARVQLVACDASDAEQIWKVCENLETRKCDP